MKVAKEETGVKRAPKFKSGGLESMLNSILKEKESSCDKGFISGEDFSNLLDRASVGKENYNSQDAFNSAVKRYKSKNDEKTTSHISF